MIYRLGLYRIEVGVRVRFSIWARVRVSLALVRVRSMVRFWDSWVSFGLGQGETVGLLVFESCVPTVGPSYSDII